MSQQLNPGQPIAINQNSSAPSATDDMFVGNDDAFPQNSVQSTSVHSTQPYVYQQQDDSSSQSSQPVVQSQPQQNRPIPVVTLPSRVIESDDFIEDGADDEDIDGEYPYPTDNSVQAPFPPMPKVQPHSTGMFSKPANTPAVSLSKMPEDQRRDAITRIFKLVLGRDPAEKDFNYYRFSALSEEGLIRNLLNLQEHKTILEQSKQFNSVKSTQNETEMKVKYLEMHLQSLQSEMTTLQELLTEKNRYIQNLRQNLQNIGGSQYVMQLSQVVEVEQPQVQYQPVQRQVITQQTQPQPQRVQPQVQRQVQFAQQETQYLQPEMQQEVAIEVPQLPIAFEQVQQMQEQPQNQQARVKSTLPSPVDELREMVAKFIRGK